jgi:3-deoxy-7-phosphoheptulonate synthase
MNRYHLKERILIDCAHGNCAKDHQKQAEVFEFVMRQASVTKAIAGVMLESHLFAGKQPLAEDPGSLSYGLSITDPCMGWDETEKLCRSINLFRKRSKCR